MADKYIINIKKARQSARLTQEQAAEAVGVSVESWKAYEYGQRIPPRETMLAICQATGCDWLALEWLRASSAGLEVLPEDITVQALPTAAITLINRVLDFAERHRDRQLLRIAEDGIIDEDERMDFDDIVHDLDGIVGAALQVKYTTGIKKNRPDAGTSKRFRASSRDENNCKIIIAHPAQKTRPNFSQREVNSL